MDKEKLCNDFIDEMLEASGNSNIFKGMYLMSNKNMDLFKEILLESLVQNKNEIVGMGI